MQIVGKSQAPPCAPDTGGAKVFTSIPHFDLKGQLCGV